MEGMLHLKVLRSPHAYARIRDIRKEKALAVAGVHAVFTWEDVPRRPFTTACHDDFHVDPDDTYMLDHVARFVGQRVAAVVAESEAAAEEGCRLLEVDYEVLPAVFDAEEAMLPGAPAIHAGEDVDSRIEDAAHNVFKKIEAETGDVAGGFAAADAVYEGTFSLPKIQHAHMETHGTIAWRGADGRIHVRTSTQTPHLTKIKLAYLFRMYPHQFHVFSEYVGGGFGGKQELLTEDLCVLAALKTGRPVKWEFTRPRSSPRRPAPPDENHDQAGRQEGRHADRDADPHRLQHRRLRQPRWRGPCIVTRLVDGNLPLRQQKGHRLRRLHEYRAFRRFPRIWRDATRVRHRVRHR